MYKLLFLLLALSFDQILAQKLAPTVISSAGAVQKSGNFSLEWTMGETITETKTTSNLIVTQGFHQSNLGLTSVKNDENLGISVFPNPAGAFLNIENPDLRNARINLINMNGQVILSDKLQLKSQQLDLNSIIQGTYILTIQDGSQQQSFTIEKTK
ncbi:MAG: T9SS type A sorting domain-containing protein [Saprospiraceae bacterium]|nr:T9SS type A sorting domain-containing protein [Saprospiraceae bacterium]